MRPTLTTAALVAASFLPTLAPAQETAEKPTEKKKGVDTESALLRQKIQLLEKGSAPGSQLRYKFVKGAEQTFEIVADQTMGVEMAGFKQPPQARPTQVIYVQSVVRAVEEDGSARVRIKVLKTSVRDPKDQPANPAVKNMLEKSLATLVGQACKMHVTSRGIVQSLEFEPSKKGLSPQGAQTRSTLQQSLLSSVIPLPEAAVGKGAQWQGKIELDQEGIQLGQTNTFTLKELGKTGGSVALKLQQTAKPQTFKAPNGMQAQLLALSSKGSGDVVFQLAQPFPKRGSAEVNISMQMEVEVAGQKRKMTMSSHTKSSVRSGVQPKAESVPTGTGKPGLKRGGAAGKGNKKP